MGTRANLPTLPRFSVGLGRNTLLRWNISRKCTAKTASLSWTDLPRVSALVGPAKGRVLKGDPRGFLRKAGELHRLCTKIRVAKES